MNNEFIVGAVTATGAAGVSASFSVLTYNSVTGDLVEQETVLSKGTYNASAQCWGTCAIQMETSRAAIQ
jgi:hypothetical protein